MSSNASEGSLVAVEAPSEGKGKQLQKAGKTATAVPPKGSEPSWRHVPAPKKKREKKVTWDPEIEEITSEAEKKGEVSVDSPNMRLC